LYWCEREKFTSVNVKVVSVYVVHVSKRYPVINSKHEETNA